MSGVGFDRIRLCRYLSAIKQSARNMKFHLNLLWRILTICSIALVVNPRSLKLLIHLVYEYDIQSGVSVIWSCSNLSCYHTQTPMGKTRHNKFLHLRNPNLIDHFTRSIAPNWNKRLTNHKDHRSTFRDSHMAKEGWKSFSGETRIELNVTARRPARVRGEYQFTERQVSSKNM